jgi:hypothetical protein
MGAVVYLAAGRITRSVIALACIGVAATVSGCASNVPLKSPSFAETYPTPVSTALVVEAVDALAAIYPPATTTIKLVRAVTSPVEDSFGTQLSRELMLSGYAMDMSQNASAIAPSEISSPGGFKEINLAYVVDQPIPGLIRMLLSTQAITLTRAFTASQIGVTPAGSWARKFVQGSGDQTRFVPSRRTRLYREKQEVVGLVVVTPASTAAAVAVNATNPALLVPADVGTPQTTTAPAHAEVLPISASARTVIAASTPIVDTALTSDKSTHTKPSVMTAVPAAKTWNAGNAASLHGVLKQWTEQAFIKLQWETSQDLAVDAETQKVIYSGSLKDALSALAAKLDALATQPIGIRFLENGSVLRVYDLKEPS